MAPVNQTSSRREEAWRGPAIRWTWWGLMSELVSGSLGKEEASEAAWMTVGVLWKDWCSEYLMLSKKWLQNLQLKRTFCYILWLQMRNSRQLVRRWFSAWTRLLGDIQISSGLVWRDSRSLSHVYAILVDSWEVALSWVPLHESQGLCMWSSGLGMGWGIMLLSGGSGL